MLLYLQYNKIKSATPLGTPSLHTLKHYTATLKINIYTLSTVFDLVKKVTVESIVKIPLSKTVTYMSVVKADDEGNTSFLFLRLSLF